MARTLAERLWAKVDVRGPDECWPWLGYRLPEGYGRIRLGGDRGTGYAHRAAWEVADGPIPPGMAVLHTCDNPPCCNRAHLFLGTDADNAADREAKRRGRTLLTVELLDMIQARFDGGESCADVAASCGFSLSTAYRAARILRNGSDAYATRGPRKIDEQAVADLRAQGLTARQIADKLNCSRSSVHRLTRKEVD